MIENSREWWVEKLTEILGSSEYEAVINPTETEKNVVVRSKGTKYPHHFGVQPKKDGTYTLFVRKVIYDEAIKKVTLPRPKKEHSKQMHFSSSPDAAVAFDLARFMAGDKYAAPITEWITPANIESDYDVIEAFKVLDHIDWKQSTNVTAGDIVYIYVSTGVREIRYKCRAIKVDKTVSDINDTIFFVNPSKRLTTGRFMELEKIKEFSGDLYSIRELHKHGIDENNRIQGPIRVPDVTKEYLNLVQMLQDTPELDPDSHDGSYEYVREVINAYASKENLDDCDYNDLNLVYLACVGTWKQGIDSKKENIKDSHLSDAEKNRLSTLLDTIWQKAKDKKYSNHEHSDVNIGMFGTGFQSFKGKTDDVAPKNFIQMCIDIKNLTIDQDIYRVCEKVLTNEFKGMRAAAASVVLHCLKPFTFPIFNSNMGAENIYIYFGLNLEKKTELSSYIDNCRIVKEFRDKSFSFKNYRILDMAARNIHESIKPLIPSNEERGDDEKVNAIGKNLILYGPPGTGKTYSTAIYAVAICDYDGDVSKVPNDYNAVMKRFKELKDYENRVAFTTFHQSYGYEEFIEGIRPDLDSNVGTDNISYKIKSGVFKDFCERAAKKDISVNFRVDGLEGEYTPSVWHVLLDGTGHSTLKEQCFKEGSIRIGWTALPENITEETEGVTKNTLGNILNFQDEMKKGDLVITCKNLKTIDAIGIITGEYEYDNSNEDYPRKHNVRWLATDLDLDVKSINGGKQLTRDTVLLCSRITGDTLLKFVNSKEISVGDNKKYVFVIDEINRGNISKIFGELITLIEEIKRSGAEEEASAILPYSGDKFSVPSNVYIIGTMNTADRSIALMDTALRRRFQFIEMMPAADVLRNIGADTVTDGTAILDVAKMLETINERITFLFDREHTIGHAFFIDLKDDPSIDNLASIFERKIIPLLQEYFYEDYQKIQLVLGDNSKNDDDLKFIKDSKVVASSVFKGSPEDVVDLPDSKYEINPVALKNIQSYIEII